MTETVVGRLLSVNVGLPNDIAWHGETVHTAVWKRAVLAGASCGGSISMETGRAT